MIISKYNVKLRRLEEQDLEMVRLKRNSPAIRNNMFYQNTITVEEQISWFKKIDNERYYYFIIEIKDKAVGLLNGNIRSFKKKVIDAGIFIWDEDFLGTRTAAAAALCSLDFYFILLKMKTVIIEVRKTNKKAIAFNEYLGFKVIKVSDEEDRVILQLEKEVFIQKATKLRRGIMRASKETTSLNWKDISFNDTDAKLIQTLRDIFYKEMNSYLPENLQK